MQDIPILSGATCCVHLVTLWRHVPTCWVLKIDLVWMLGRNTIVVRTWPNDYNIMQHLQMLHEKFDHFQFWANNTQHVTTRCDTVAKRTWLVSPGNVAIVWLGLKMVNSFVCYIMLWSFGQVLATMLHPGSSVVRFLVVNMSIATGGQTHATCWTQQCCDILR